MSTSAIGRLRSTGIDRLAQALAEKGEPDHEQDDRETGEQARPPDPGRSVRDCAVDVVSPLRGLGRLDAVAEKAERRERQDGVGRVERRERRDVLDDVEEDVLPDDRERFRPECARRLDEGLLPDADRVVSDHAEVERDVDDRDRDRCREDPLTDSVREQEGDDDREQQEREDEQRVHDQDQQAVELSSEVAGEQAERDSDADRDEERDEHDLELGLRPPDHSREDVRRLDVRPHQMLARRRRELRETACRSPRTCRSRTAR